MDPNNSSNTIPIPPSKLSIIGKFLLGLLISFAIIYVSIILINLPLILNPFIALALVEMVYVLAFVEAIVFAILNHLAIKIFKNKVNVKRGIKWGYLFIVWIFISSFISQHQINTQIQANNDLYNAQSTDTEQACDPLSDVANRNRCYTNFVQQQMEKSPDKSLAFDESLRSVCSKIINLATSTTISYADTVDNQDTCNWYISDDESRISSKNSASSTTPTVSIDASSLNIIFLPAAIRGTASNTEVVALDIEGTNTTDPSGGYRVIFGRANMPVVNNNWSVAVPVGTFKGFSGPYKVDVAVMSNNIAEAEATGVVTLKQ